jgi:hypothetical protein
VAERPAGSDRGRPSIDWEEAFRAYASMPDSERSYGAVAKLYSVSVRTVEAHGRKEHWKERLSRIKADAAASADEQLANARAAKMAELDLLVDASLTSYAQQLRAGSVKVVPADLLRLFKLRGELWAEETVERGARRAQAEDNGDLEDAERRKRELIAALEEAGAFERLRTSLSPPHEGSKDGATEAGM